MVRTFWAALAAIGFAISSGCSMCDSCFDYTYPAYGGKYCWDADDCCRAGSAFCHVVSGDSRVSGQEVEEIHDPVPDAPEFVPDPESTEQTPVVPPPPELEPPTDLTPADEPPSLPLGEIPEVEIPDTRAPPFEDLDLPPLDSLIDPD